MNKYYILGIAPILIFIIVVFCVIEYQLFSKSILWAIISNLVIAWIFFFLYKANKQNAISEKNDE